MKKYLIKATFIWNEDMMQLIPQHREIINDLIDHHVIEHYAVSMEIQTVWITINAKTKHDARSRIKKSPLYKYWTVEVSELMVWDGQNYRLPAVQLN